VLVHGVNVGLDHAVWDLSASERVRLLNDVPDDRDGGRRQRGDVVDGSNARPGGTESLLICNNRSGVFVSSAPSGEVSVAIR